MRATAIGLALMVSSGASGGAWAHNDWGLPLIGGAVGGYALSSILHSQTSKPAATHTAPAPQPSAQAASASINSTSSVEARLHQLDQLAAQGYITKQEYDERRQAIINSL